MRPLRPRMCDVCKRRIANKNVDNACEAYPNGIPDAVYISGHIFPKPGDGGMQFIPMNSVDYERYNETTKKDEDNFYEYCKRAYKDGEFIEKI